jgi:protein-tyrosine phosphatase
VHDQSDGSVGPADPPTVLAVCTGNICRSPAVERLLAARLGPHVRTTSAGVRAVVGAPIFPPVVALLEQAGADTGGFAAQQLTAGTARGADLILALTRRHRGAVVELAPSAVRRTFTLRELARFAAHVGADALPDAPLADRLAALVPLAAAQRGQVLVDPRDDDVPDPYGGSDALYRLAFEHIRSAVDAIAGVLCPAGVPEVDGMQRRAVPPDADAAQRPAGVPEVDGTTSRP